MDDENNSSEELIFQSKEIFQNRLKVNQNNRLHEPSTCRRNLCSSLRCKKAAQEEVGKLSQEDEHTARRRLAHTAQWQS